VGLLRLDIARPFDGRPGIDPDYKIYFGLGTTF
jgi:outer membrane translocation and assembly module TamA